MSSRVKITSLGCSGGLLEVKREQELGWKGEKPGGLGSPGH